MSKGTVALISGGLDSATLLGWLLTRPDETIRPIHAITFQYGSKHQKAETESAMQVVQAYLTRFPDAIETHNILQLDPVFFSGSALTDPETALPENRSMDEMTGGEPAPSYVPARNSVLLSLAAGRADAWDCKYVAYAAHFEDAPGYPDCTPEYAQAMQFALELGTKNHVKLLYPFIEWSKSDIIDFGLQILAPYEYTHSCYKGTKPACGVCDTCILRIESFKRLGAEDPIEYAIDIDWGY